MKYCAVTIRGILLLFSLCLANSIVVETSSTILHAGPSIAALSAQQPFLSSMMMLGPSLTSNNNANSATCTTTLLAGASVAISITSLWISLRTWNRRCEWENNELLLRSRQKSMLLDDAGTTAAARNSTTSDDGSKIKMTSLPPGAQKNPTPAPIKEAAKVSTAPAKAETTTEEIPTNPSTKPNTIRATIESQMLDNGLNVKPIGVVRSIYRLCVGTPRQGLLAPHARGRIEITLPVDAAMDSVKDLETFSHIWILFVFHLNTVSKNNKVSPKIAPPALGGTKVGLLATRSPHRFNPIGITLAKLDRVEIKPKNIHKSQKQKGSRVILHISGLDLVDGTPVLDVKPFVPTYDSVDQIMGPNLSSTSSSTSTSNSGTHTSSVRLPPWVSEGLATRRSVTISETARTDLETILADHDNNNNNNNNNNKKGSSPLEFYGRDNESKEDALENMLACIVEVLAMDVRSSFQTKKARSGKYQAERANRMQEKKPQSKSDAGVEGKNSEPGSTISTNEISECTQQLDNLLLHYTVTQGAQLQRSESAGSGAEDQVCVTSIEPF